jgi:RNA polymerase sigma-70 factor (ECF subfamily)
VAPADPSDISRILRSLADGDVRAADELVPILYEELRGIAQALLRRERPDHTLQPTALVSEAYLRLVKDEGMRWQDRAHFLAWSAKVMRRVLVDHARGKRAEKRGGERKRVPLPETLIAFEDRGVELEALDAALERLAGIDERKARIVELRFFGGLSIPESAEVVGVSHATVEREWRFARAWLYSELMGGES